MVGPRHTENRAGKGVDLLQVSVLISEYLRQRQNEGIILPLSAPLLPPSRCALVAPSAPCGLFAMTMRRERKRRLVSSQGRERLIERGLNQSIKQTVNQTNSQSINQSINQSISKLATSNKICRCIYSSPLFDLLF